MDALEEQRRDYFDIYSYSPRKIALTLLSITFMLILFHFIAMNIYFNTELGLKKSLGLKYWHVELFDLDAEESFGTWFSTLLLFLISRILFRHSYYEKEYSCQKEETWWKSWFAIAIGFSLLSLDEVVGIHEYVNSLVKIYGYRWTHVGFPLVVLCTLIFLPFYWHLPGKFKMLFALSGMIYFGGAIGVEHFTDERVNTLHYNMWTILEEGMEISGCILMIYSSLLLRETWTNKDQDGLKSF